MDHGASYGLMLNKHKQAFLFHFDGAADDPVFYVEWRLFLRLPSFLRVASARVCDGFGWGARLCGNRMQQR